MIGNMGFKLLMQDQKSNTKCFKYCFEIDTAVRTHTNSQRHSDYFLAVVFIFNLHLKLECKHFDLLFASKMTGLTIFIKFYNIPSINLIPLRRVLIKHNC